MFMIKGNYQATIELDLDDIIEKEGISSDEDTETIEEKVRDYMSDYCETDDPAEDDYCVEYFTECVVARLYGAIH